jgi:hypothetical protein
MNLIKAYKKDKMIKTVNRIKILQEDQDSIVIARNTSCLVATLNGVDILPGGYIRETNSVINTINTMLERPIFRVEY